MGKAIFIILTLAGFASGAEMEVTDRLSVDGATLLRSTLTVSGDVHFTGAVYKGTHTMLDDSMLDDFTVKFSSSILKAADRLELNIMRNAFQTAVTGNLSKFGMVDGMMDEFTDESGVDTTGSTNQVYDPTNYIYSPWKTGNELDYMEYATDGAAQAAYVSNAPAYGNTGGEITTDGDYTVHKFTAVGAASSFTAVKSGNVAILVVGGGGGGSYGGGGGGGGGGGYQYYSSFAVTAKVYTVAVGDGGAEGVGGTGGSNGSDSVFDSITAKGGGGGSWRTNGKSGGSGGGAGVGNGGTYVGGTGSQGHDGGTSCGNPNYYVGAGGGGAGAVGASAGTTSMGGVGGDGTSSAISGSAVTYAGGGGGSNGLVTAPGVGGGSGGGGKAGDSALGGVAGNGTAGTPNTGGGGGSGGSGNSDAPGGRGGSGIVIIRCHTTDFLGTPPLQSYSEATIKTQGSYSLKGIAATSAGGKTLTKTFTTCPNLSGVKNLRFDIRANRTGSNIKMGIHDTTDGTPIEITPNIIAKDAWQTVNWDLSAVPDGNKGAIDKIIVTIANADAANTFYIDNFYGPNLIPDMKLKSNAYIAESAPAKARIVLFEEDVDTCTLNTDITASVSRDNGTTYSTATLADEGNWAAAKRILSGIADISTQPIGTNMKWRVDTYNNKDMKLHGVGLTWD